jgi:hypothetical protein
MCKPVPQGCESYCEQARAHIAKGRPYRCVGSRARVGPSARTRSMANIMTPAALAPCHRPERTWAINIRSIPWINNCSRSPL